MKGTELINEEKTALYLLSCMKGMLSDKLLHMYRHYGSFSEAYRHEAGEHFKAGLFKQERMCENYAALKDKEGMLLERLGTMSENGIRIVTMFDDEYPDRLEHINDMPPILYVRGRLPEDTRPSVAVIGSRKCSSYGETTAELLAGELASNGIQVVSGLAYGVDSAAAAGSLRGGRESYAVLGCGINICYPTENWKLFERMSRGEGGVISEFPPDTAALGFHFVLRNRIIAGLADIVVVVEAGDKSGTSSTIEYALSQGKDIMAVPGRITDRTSAGCNRLIRDGAGIVTSPEDIMELVRSDMFIKCSKNSEREKRKRPSSADRTNDDKQRIEDILSSGEMHIETVSEKCGKSIAETAAWLMQLEAEGRVISRGSSYYMLRPSFY
ncbi:MAG: DNA-processing protein DprA [Eubacteriales bacterium]|nr:DNA-processing protein DprA [Eubacteriales bacterium]